jgi:HD-GYP domain-containing protein (c-di-GMP phosphodiesterase class II)
MSRRAGSILPWAIVAACATIPGAVLEWAGGTVVDASATAHFALVTAAALAGALASAVLSVAGVRRRDGRTVLLGTAFSTMTALLAVHAFATPGVLAGLNGVVGFAGGASLPAGALVLALTALPGLRRPCRMGGLIVAQVVIAAAILVLGATALLWPALVPPVPAARSMAAYMVLAAGLLLIAVLAARAVRTWQLTRRPADVCVVAGLAWLGLALVAQMTTAPPALGFWLGHLLELSGVLALAGPAALDLRRAGPSLPLVGDLGATALVAHEHAFLGARVRALMVRLAEKDVATEGHTRRVALLAVAVGESLGLPPARLRTLAVGGLLHDMGKLAVPTAVLTKPGPLDDDEFAEIRKHPEAGVRLLEELGGFVPEVRRLVHDHHERLDGSGYPRGLTADDLDLETRILAVCDVYDALVSDRVYRAAWPADRALALLREDAGRLFDDRCVTALEALVAPPWVADVAQAAPTPADAPAARAPARRAAR